MTYKLTDIDDVDSQREDTRLQSTPVHGELDTNATITDGPAKTDNARGLPEDGSTASGGEMDIGNNQAVEPRNAGAGTATAASNLAGGKPSASGCSERKRESNRINSGNSTGPRTARGKRISRENALKHGALAKKVLFDEHGRLRSKDLGVLFDQLCDEYGAVTVGQRLLIECLVVTYRRNLITVDLEDALAKSGSFAAVTAEGARVHRYAAANQKSLLSLLKQLDDSREAGTAQNNRLTGEQCDELGGDLEPVPDSGVGGPDPQAGSPCPQAPAAVSEPIVPEGEKDLHSTEITEAGAMGGPPAPTEAQVSSGESDSAEVPSAMPLESS